MNIRELLSELHHSYDADRNPFKKDDTITVYHGFYNYQHALFAAQHGISGALKANRVYSYENDNNPKGLFVTPRLDLAQRFATSHKISVIIQFDASYSELEAPIWPGNTWTGYGGKSEYWGWGRPGTAKRNTARKGIEQEYKNNESHPEWVRLSDNPHLAATLLSGINGEPQALFIGHLDPDRITAFYVRDTSVSNERLTLSREDFLEKYSNLIDKKHDSYPDYAFKIFKPNDNFDPEVFKEKIKYTDKQLKSFWEAVRKKENPAREFQRNLDQELWPKQIIQAFHWFKKQYAVQKPVVQEISAHMSTDPDNYGTTLNSWNAKERHKVKEIPMTKLITFEHPDKMKDPTSKQNMMKIAKAYHMGEKIPPIMVKKHEDKYMVLDGHHRFFAAKLAGIRAIPAIIIPDDKITID